MAVVIRLARTGKKGERKFRIVVKEKHSRRDGAALETLGWYEKTTGDHKQLINKERFDYWISQGALPSNTVMELVKE